MPSSKYPGAYDTPADPENETLQKNTHPELHQEINDIIEAMEKELGLEPSGPQTTVTERFETIIATVEAIKGVAGTVTNGGLIWNGSNWVNQLIGAESLILPWLSPTATQVGPVPRFLLSANNGMVLGTVYYVSFIAEKTRKITKMGAYVGTKGETNTLARMGLNTVDETYGCTLAAHTANETGFWTAAGATPKPLVSNNLDGTAGTFPTEFELVRGTFYVVSMIAVGGVAPNMRGPSVSTTAGQVAAQNPPLVGAVTAQADIGGGNKGETKVTRASMVGSSICPGFFLE